MRHVPRLEVLAVRIQEPLLLQSLVSAGESMDSRRARPSNEPTYDTRPKITRPVLVSYRRYLAPIDQLVPRKVGW